MNMLVLSVSEELAIMQPDGFEKMSASFYQILLLVMYFCEFEKSKKVVFFFFFFFKLAKHLAYQTCLQL